MRFCTKQSQYYCRIDSNARSMYLIILNQEGEVLQHLYIPVAQMPFLKTLQPTGEDSGLAYIRSD